MNETFQKLWFTPTPAHDKETMTRKILNITDVVGLTYQFVVSSNKNNKPQEKGKISHYPPARIILSNGEVWPVYF